MSIQIVPVTAANEAEWKRRCAASVNQIIQKLSDAQLESLAALEYTGNAGYAIVVNATEDGFELSAAGGGGTTTNALTINNGGAGAASGATFNGSAAVTISYNTVGAAASSHTHAQADVTGLTTADSPQFAGINLGHASDTTLTRVSAGVVAIEGVNVVTTAGGVTFGADISVPDEAYDATNWNGSVEVPTKNAVRDKLETMGGWTTVKLASDYVNATTSYTLITDGSNPFSWTPPANSDIEIEVDVMIQTVLAANAAKIQTTVPGAANNTQYGYVDYEYYQTTSAKSWQIAGFTTSGATVTFSTGALPSAGVPYPQRSRVKLRTGSSPAAITFEAAAESAAANACTIKAGSTMRYRVVP